MVRLRANPKRFELLRRFSGRRRVDEAAGLPPPQLGIMPAGAQQLGVGALFDDAAAMSWPASRMAPSSGSKKRSIRLTSVDLPAPDRPIRPMRSPGWMVSDSPSISPFSRP